MPATVSRTNHAHGSRTRWLAALVLLSLLLAPLGGVSADTTNGNLPGGTSIQVAINTPADGALLPPGTVAVTGSAAIGQGVPIANTALAYVIDVSGSTGTSGGSCGTILACEKAATIALNNQAASLGTIGAVGVAVFGDNGAAADVGPVGGEQPTTGPATNAGGGPGRDIDEVVNSVVAGSVGLFTVKNVGSNSTNFGAGITAALGITAASGKPNKIVIFLSDGLANTGPDIATLVPSGGVKFFTFAVGAGSSCTSDPDGLGSLQEIAVRTGGTCTQVSNPADLPNILPGVVASQLTGLQIKVDAGSYVAIPNGSISAPLPKAGPTSVTYSTSVGPLAAGSHTICVQANGTDGGGAGAVEDCHTITINAPPTVNAGGPYSGNEGNPIALGGTANDPDGPSLTTTWTYAPVSGVDSGATCAFANAGAPSTTVTCTDDGSYTLTLTANDGINPAVTSTATLTVANVAPILNITAPTSGALYVVNTAVNLTAPFTDAGTNDTHTCAINWDDATPMDTFAATDAGGTGNCNRSRTFTTAGVYTIQVTVTDDDGGAATQSVMVVVYDPSAGFVTGGGWIDSQAGAYRPDPTLTGRANFGFVSKYKKGATVPEGQTEFQFQVGNLNFHSEVYQWLVIAGPKAQYKGTGTINGSGNYGFMLTATDGQLPGGGGADKFRIKIWDIATSQIIYDNAFGSSEDIDAANPQIISGGSIVIHSK
jgi:hypothetical protein